MDGVWRVSVKDLHAGERQGRFLLRACIPHVWSSLLQAWLASLLAPKPCMYVNHGCWLEERKEKSTKADIQGLFLSTKAAVLDAWKQRRKRRI